MAVTVKNAIRDRVHAHADSLIGLSHRIHAHPETAFEEHRAAAWTSDVLASAGFDVTAAAGGLETAFSASCGDGPLTVATVAFCAEYDALPGLGHACGHNLIAAASTGAGLALAPYADELGLTVKVVGTPAEERGGGDAMTLAQVAIGLLRRQLPRDQHVHGVVTSAGEAPNVIPARSTASYEIRATAAEDLAGLRARVEACFQGAALATGCQARLTRPEPDYLDFRDDAGLARLYAANARALGRPEPVEREPFAMTDMANVSHVVRAIHPMLDIGSGDAVPHDPAFAAAALSATADGSVLDAAVVLALTAADLRSGAFTL